MFLYKSFPTISAKWLTTKCILNVINDELSEYPDLKGKFLDKIFSIHWLKTW